MSNNPQPEVSPIQKALYIIGLVICIVLMCIISGVALFDFASTGPIVYLLLIGLAPITLLFLVLVLSTSIKETRESYWTARKEEVFNYTPEMLMKEYYKVLGSIYGQPLTLHDISKLRIEFGRKYHPDRHPKHMRPFNDELIAFLNQLLDNLTRDLKRQGYINWDDYARR